MAGRGGGNLNSLLGSRLPPRRSRGIAPSESRLSAGSGRAPDARAEDGSPRRTVAEGAGGRAA